MPVCLMTNACFRVPEVSVFVCWEVAVCVLVGLIN